MVEMLVILRDAILAIVLSWIGVDYQPAVFETSDAQQDVKLVMHDTSPVLRVSESVEMQTYFLRETEQIHS